MKLKKDDKGNVVVVDDKPVYVDDQGKDVPFDYPATLATISRLNGEARSHRERAEAAEGKLKGFEGIDDPAAAKKALGIVKNLDDKKLVDAGEVEKVKEEAIKAVRGEFAPVVTERDKLKADLHNEMIGGRFSRSKFIADKIAVPVDMIQATFGRAFQIKDGKVIATGPDGREIYSKARPGEVADFDEALEALVDGYPHKAHILKGSGASGGGAGPSGGGAGGKKTMPREQFDKTSEADRRTFLKEGGTVV